MTQLSQATASPASTAFHPAFRAFERGQAADPAWLRQRRDQAFSAFLALGLPTRQDEDWRYTSLRQLGAAALHLAAAEAVEAAVLAPYIDAADLTLVFVNGQLTTPVASLGSLPVGLEVQTLATALAAENASVLRLLKRFAPGKQPFTQLNDAFLHSGLCLTWAEKAVTERRIHLLHVTTPSAEGRGAAFVRHLISLGAGAVGEVVETFITASGEPSPALPHGLVTNAVTDIDLAEGAELRHSRCQLEALSTVHIGRVRAELAKEAKLASLSLSAGARLARVDIDVGLGGPRSEVQLSGLYLTRGEQHCDHHTTVDHRVPEARSNQLYKGILADSSRAVFNGVVRVHRDAQQTVAFQLNRNLLLSSEAEVDTKPELQIDADDVKCSHGASIGQLNDDQLFYLTSRGLPPAEAQRLLVQAFADDVMMRAPRLHAALRPLTMGYFL